MAHSPTEAARRLGLAAVCLWATAATAFKLGLAETTPYMLVLTSSVVSLVFLGIWALASGRRPDTRMMLSALPRGFLNPFLYYLVLLEAYDRLPAQVAMVVNYLWPVMLVLIHAALPGGRLSGRSLAAILTSFCGVALLAALYPRADGGVSTSGILLALASTVIWAVYWLSSMRGGGAGSARLLCNFLWGCLFLVAWGLAGGALRTPGIRALAASAWIGIFEMGLTYVVWLAALSRARDPAQVGNLIYLTPFLSLAFIALVLGEPLRVSTLAGLALVLAGILLQRGVGTAPPSGSAPAVEP